MRFATADCETDPFMAGRAVHPFVWGFYDGAEHRHFWGDDCTAQFLAFLRDYPEPLQLFGHNAGKFDWLFLVEHMTGSPKLIGPRVIRAELFHHTLRDSYANMPVPLRSIKPMSGAAKADIDYQKMHRWKRERHRREILDYLQADCLTLYDAVHDWHEMFGTRSETMASAAMRQLKASMEEDGVAIEHMTERQDALYRPYYYGGRVECFAAGELRGRFAIYDVNSMYPHAMKQHMHPIGTRYRVSCQLGEHTDFAEVDATSDGCLPARDVMGRIAFPKRRGVFLATGHELRMAMSLGKLQVHSVKRAVQFAERACFAPFVDRFARLRQDAKDAGDEMRILFFKLVLNSAYGKFALNPDRFLDMRILPHGIRPNEACIGDAELAAMPAGAARDEAMRRAWSRHAETQNTVFWSRGAITYGRHVNVATAASITGAARAQLMAGLAQAVRPVYCDTDSIVCESLPGVDIHPSRVGAWKFEGAGDRAAIAGKKLYAIWQGEAVLKQASKGVSLSAEQIRQVACGAQLEHVADAPVIGLSGKQGPLIRRIRATIPLGAAPHA